MNQLPAGRARPRLQRLIREGIEAGTANQRPGLGRDVGKVVFGIDRISEADRNRTRRAPKTTGFLVWHSQITNTRQCERRNRASVR